MALLVNVGLSPGINMQKLSTMLRLSQASVSRNVAALGSGPYVDRATKQHRNGAGLLRTVVEPVDPRRRMVRLTPQGKAQWKGLGALDEPTRGGATGSEWWGDGKHRVEGKRVA